MKRPQCIRCEKQSIKGAPLCAECLDKAMTKYDNESYSFKTSAAIIAVILFIITQIA